MNEETEEEFKASIKAAIDAAKEHARCGRFESALYSQAEALEKLTAKLAQYI